MNTTKLKKHLRYIVPQIRLALIREPGSNSPIDVNSPCDIERFIEPLKHYAEEHFVAFHLNSRNQVTSYHIVSHGTVSASLVHPREVFKAALLSNSTAIIVAHNHPGGSLEASLDDISTTATLIACGELLGVKIIDHIIVSSFGFASMRESHPNLWV